MRRVVGALTLAAFGSAQAAPPASPSPIAFVACPVLRDTSTVGCWLTEYQGETYYLGISEDQSAEFDPPSLGHRMLVEGVVTNKPRVCGGIPIAPVHLSVLEADASCNKLLPADAKFDLPFKAPRGPGPREKRQSGGPPGALPAPPEPPKPPYAPREFVVAYDFDNERAGLSTRAMVQAMNYANAIGAKSVIVTAYRGSVLLEDGKTITEKAWIAERRAKTLGETLGEIGIAPATIQVKWVEKPTPAKGKGLDAQNRRATIRVVP